MPYIGKQPEAGQFRKLDSIATVNNQAAYTMQYDSSDFKPAGANHLIVSVNGVIQEPGTAFSIDGATITFSENLVTGDVIDYIISMGEVGSHVVPQNDSVDINKISSSIMKSNAIRVNDTSLENAITIAADENAMVAGPFTINQTLTINGTFTVV